VWKTIGWRIAREEIKVSSEFREMYRPSQHKIQGLLVHASANQQVQGL
jgi:hypothetical protein